MTITVEVVSDVICPWCFIGKAEDLLKGNEGMEALDAAGQLSRRHVVDGVPFFIVNGEITLAGAQNSDAFLASFLQTSGSN